MLFSELFPPASKDDEYRGDITRRKKLIIERKEGKKRMKSVGNIEITHRAFLAQHEVED